MVEGDRATFEGVPRLSLKGESGRRVGYLDRCLKNEGLTLQSQESMSSVCVCVCVCVCVRAHPHACEGTGTIWNLLWVERKACSKPGGERP